MGAEVVKLDGGDVADALVRFASKKGVTLLIVGQSRRSRLQHFMKGSLVERLVNNAQGLDVLVVSFDPAWPAGGKP
jgi:two-component system sensor histidine kinase KdpD